jgi:hypothetical protein
MCMYYQIVGIKIRKNCPDFRQREEKSMSENKSVILITEIADKLGTTVEQLLNEYGDAETVIEMYNTGKLRLLSETN